MKIVLLVLAALCLLLLCPVRLHISWQGEPAITAKWLFLRLKLLPRLPQKQTVADAKKPQKAKTEEKKQQKAAKPADTITQYADLLPEVLGGLKGFVLFLLHHIRLTRLQLQLLVAREDAAETAIAFGRANQAVYTALGLVQKLLKVRCKPKIEIGFDFLSGQERAEGCAELALAPLTALAGALWLAARLLKAFILREKQDQPVQTTVKKPQP